MFITEICFISAASAVCAVTVDPSDRLLCSGHEDGRCMLYDIQGSRVIQIFKPHSAELRSAHLSPRSLYLLTGSFDRSIVLTNLHDQGKYCSQNLFKQCSKLLFLMHSYSADRQETSFLRSTVLHNHPDWDS